MSVLQEAPVEIDRSLTLVSDDGLEREYVLETVLTIDDEMGEEVEYAVLIPKDDPDDLVFLRIEESAEGVVLYSVEDDLEWQIVFDVYAECMDGLGADPLGGEEEDYGDGDRGF